MCSIVNSKSWILTKPCFSGQVQSCWRSLRGLCPHPCCWPPGCSSGTCTKIIRATLHKMTPNAWAAALQLQWYALLQNCCRMKFTKRILTSGGHCDISLVILGKCICDRHCDMYCQQYNTDMSGQCQHESYVYVTRVIMNHHMNEMALHMKHKLEHNKLSPGTWRHIYVCMAMDCTSTVLVVLHAYGIQNRIRIQVDRYIWHRISINLNCNRN